MKYTRKKKRNFKKAKGKKGRGKSIRTYNMSRGGTKL